MASKEKKRPNSENDSVQSEFIRRFKMSPFLFIGTIVILVIIVIAFVFVPAIVPMDGFNINWDFGSYNKIPIKYVPGNHFARTLQILSNYSQSRNGDNNQLEIFQIWRLSFEEAVARIAVLEEMKQAGYTAPSEVVDREIVQLPRFQENGRFSATLYRQLDNSTRMSLWKQVQEEIAVERYQSDLMSLNAPSQEAAFISSMASPQRTFEMAAFPLSAYPDQEVISYITENPDLFRVTHLSIITITSNEREAQQVLASVRDGTAAFEDAARTQSKDGYAEKGGDMGIKMAYELIPEIPDAQERERVINLAKGEFSPIIKIPTGWAFFRAEDTPYPADTGDEALLGKIRTYIMYFERGRVEDWLIAEAENFITTVNESDFDTALYLKGIEKRNFGPLPVNYGDAELLPSLASFSVPELSGAALNESFWQAAFSTPLKTPSPPLVLGAYVAVLYPLEESAAPEDLIENIKNNYSSYLFTSSYLSGYIMPPNIRTFFLSNNKLEDRFEDSFLQYIWAPN
jgi:hypothetical protein